MSLVGDLICGCSFVRRKLKVIELLFAYRWDRVSL
jgi:hypothetical protein